MKVYPLLLLLALASCKTDPLRMCERNFRNDSIPLVTRIAFGSCADEELEQPILNKVVEHHPDLFIYLGDNIYGDTYNMRELESEYGQLSCKPEFQNLIHHTKVLATWDDHDYGHNDVGKEFPSKEESKQIFLRFWGEEYNQSRQSHPGIYTSYYFGDSAHRVQVILLDLRTFRDKLKTENDYYVPNFDSTAELLGDEQWTWLAHELEQPARLRIIGSSSRFATEADGGECWGNFPFELQRMFTIIKTKQANGIVFISGDIHFAELCKRQEPGLYPLYDFTASPLARHANDPWPNTWQVATAPVGYNFGLIEIDWQQPDPVLHCKAYGEAGDERMSYDFPLSQIHF